MSENRVLSGMAPFWLALSRTVLVCGVLLLLSGHLLVLAIPNTRDMGIWAYAGWRWVNGDVPYRDFFEHKPPGVFALYAASELLGGGTGAVRLFDLAGALVATWCVWRMARELAPTGLVPVANLAAGLFAALLGSPQLSYGFGQTETLSLGFIIPAYALVIFAGRSTNARGLVLAAGVLVGITLSIRASAILDALLLLGAVAVLRQRLTLVARFAFGAAVPLAVYAFYAILTSSLPQAFDALVRFNAQYAAGLGPRDDPLITGVTTTLELLPLFAGAAVGGGFAVGALLRSREPAHWLVMAWLIVAVVEFLAPLRFYQHYYVYLAAPLCVAVAMIPIRAFGRLSSATLLGVVSLTLGASLAFNVSLVPIVAHRVAGDLAVPQERAAAILSRDTPATGRVMLWGMDPDVLYLARRASPTRFFYTDLVSYPGGRARYVEMLDGFVRFGAQGLVLGPDDITHKPRVPRSLCDSFGGLRRSADADPDRWLVYAGSGPVTLTDDAAAGRIECVPDGAILAD